MKEMVVKMLKAENVLNILFSLAFILFFSCKSYVKPTNNKNYVIEKHKSKDLFIGVSIKAYDNLKEEYLLKPTVVINNVYLKGEFFSLGIGYHNIKILYLAKKPVIINNLRVGINDSIVIKTHLQDKLIID